MVRWSESDHKQNKKGPMIIPVGLERGGMMIGALEKGSVQDDPPRPRMTLNLLKPAKS